MKERTFFIVVIIIIMTVNACGQTPEPTLNVEQIQGTAVALAITSIAITKAALPSNTPLPSQIPTLAVTATPFPTLPPAFPTSEILGVVPTTTQVNPCNEPPLLNQWGLQ